MAKDNDKKQKANKKAEKVKNVDKKVIEQEESNLLSDQNSQIVETKVDNNTIKEPDKGKAKKVKPEKAIKDKTKKEKTKKNKKKRGCCYNCCMSILVFNFICVALIVGVGLTLGNQYCKQNLNLSLGEVFGVVRGIFTSNDKFIDNAYTEKDEQGFFDSLGESLLLEKGVVKKEDFEEILVKGIKGTVDAGPANYIVSDSEEEEKSDSQITDLMGDYLANILKAENFDKNKLNSIGTDNPADTNLKITDKEIAAFVNETISVLADEFIGEYLKNSIPLDDYGVDIEELNIKEYLKLNQLKLNVKKLNINGEATNVNTATVTVSVNFDQILKDVKKAINISQVLPEELTQYASIITPVYNGALSLINVILPNNFYLTVELGLSHDIEPQVYINNMGHGNDQMENLYKLGDKYINQDGGLKKTLNDFILYDSGIKNSLDDIRGKVNFGEIFTEGGLDCDIYQLALDLSGMNDNLAEDDKLTSDDVLQTIKIILSDNEEYLNEIKSKDYNYKNVQFEHDENGKLVFENGDPVLIEDPDKQYYVTSGEELEKLLDDYEQVILAKFKTAYGLDTENNDLQSIIDVFSSDVSEDKVFELFDAQQIKKIIKGEAQGLVLTDKMLGAMFMKMLPSLINDAKENNGLPENLPDDFIGVEYIYIEEKDASSTHYVMNLGLNIKIISYIETIGLDDFVVKLMKGLINDNFFIEAGMDITLNLDNNEYLPTLLKLNGNEVNVVDKILHSLGALGQDNEGENKSLFDFIDDTLEPVREMINSMSESLPDLELKRSGIKLPDVYAAVYSVISKELNQDKTPTDEGYINEEQFKSALKTLADEPLINNDDFKFYADDEDVEEYNSGCEQALLDELNLKYGITNQDEKGEHYTLAEVLYVLGIGNLKDTSKVQGLEIYDLIMPDQLEALADDDEIKNIYITNIIYREDPNYKDMLSALVREVAFGSEISFKDLGDNFGKQNLLYTEMKTENDKRFLSITVKVKISDLLQSEGSNEAENVAEESSGDTKRDFINSILPETPSIITIQIDISDLSEGEEYAPCKIIFNDNNESSETIMQVLNNLGIDLDFEEVAKNIRDTIDQLDETINIKFTDTGLELPNVFDAINDLVLKDNKFETDGGIKVKNALKGIYRTSNTEVESGTTKLQKFENSLESKKANENCKESLNDISDKYFLDGEVKTAAESGDFDNLFQAVGFNDLSAENIKISNKKDEQITDSKYLAYDIRDILTKEQMFGQELTEDQIINSLNPRITEGDLGAIITSRNENSEYNIHSIKFKVINKEEDEKSELERHLILYATISLKSLFTGDGDEMKKLINVDTIFAEIDVILGKYPEGISDETPDEDKYYEATISVNNMDDSEIDSLKKVVSSFGANTNDIDNLNVEVGKAIYKAFSTLNDSYGEDGYVLTEHGIILSDIYTLLGKSILSDKEKSHTGIEVKRAVQGMFELPKELLSIRDKSFNFIESETQGDSVHKDYIIKNPVSESFSNVLSGTQLTEILDKDFGAFINNRESNDKNIAQLNILASGTSHGTKQTEDRQWLNSLKVKTLDDNEPYIILTIKISTEKFGEINGNSASIMPKEMLLTVILKHNTSEDKFDYHDIIINNMTANDKNVIIDLSGTNEALENLEEEANTYVELINKSLERIKTELISKSIKSQNGGVSLKATFVDDTDNSTTARGRIKFEPPLP